MDYLSIVKQLMNKDISDEETKSMLIEKFNEGKFIEMFSYYLSIEKNVDKTIVLFDHLLGFTGYEIKSEEVDKLLEIKSVNDYISDLLSAEEKVKEAPIVKNELTSTIEDKYLYKEAVKDIDELINSTTSTDSAGIDDNTKKYLK